MKKYLLLLIAIILLGTLLRFYKLGTIPNGLNLDEVSMGYNAYSILKTGRDEYKQFLPMYFRSHDDYKPPVIIYSQVVSIAALGLSAVAVRLPSALAGIGAVVFTFLLCRELFPKRQKIAYIAAFLLAISPWHLQFTRTAYEVGIQPLFTSAGLYFFLRGMRTKKIVFLVLSGLILSLGTHLYTASRVFIPLFITLLAFLYRDEFWNKKITFVVWVGALALFLLPTLYLFTTPAGQTRFKGTNLFQDPVGHERTVQWQITDWLRGDNRSNMLFHREVLAYIPELTQTYLSHFRPDFLFLGNSHTSTNYVPDTGLLYIWEIPFVITGLFFLFRRNSFTTAWVVVGWLLLSQLPAAVTTGVPTSIRATITLPVWQILSAIGLAYIFAFVPKRWRLLVMAAGVGIATYFLAYYLHMYYVHAPVERGKFWYTPYEQMVKDTAELATQYDQVIISTEIDQPQSFFLFYTAYDPSEYQKKEGGTVSGSFSENRNHFRNFYFKRIDYGQMSKTPKTLFVGRPEEFNGNAIILRKYYYPDGKPAVFVGR